jgi:hypothetical protein
LRWSWHICGGWGTRCGGKEMVAVGCATRGRDTVAIIKGAASQGFLQVFGLEIRGKPQV